MRGFFHILVSYISDKEQLYQTLWLMIVVESMLTLLPPLVQLDPLFVLPKRCTVFSKIGPVGQAVLLLAFSGRKWPLLQ